MKTNDKNDKTLKFSQQFKGLKRFPKGVRVEVWSTPDARHDSGNYTYLRIVTPGLHLTSGLPFQKDPLLRGPIRDLFKELVGDNEEVAKKFTDLVEQYSE